MMIKAKDRDYEKLARKYGKPLLTIPTDEIRLVFMLVLDESADDVDKHWWCLVMDLVKKQFWMIDSLYWDPYEDHAELLTKLVKAVDVLFQLKDPLWELGSLDKWPQKVVDMVKETDTFSCGVLMLGCIKHCARSSFDTSFPLDKNLRKTLFLEDANNYYNELRDKFDDIRPKERIWPKRTGSSQLTM